MCKHLLKIQRLILALLIFGGGIFYTSSAPARVCFLPDSTDCGEGDVDVPDVQITCATYGGYEDENTCLENRANKTAQTCTLNSGCYYPKCAYDSERNCKNDNPDKKCLSQDVDGVKCWYSQPKTCSEQGYKNTPCATDEDSGTVPNTLEASDGPCYKCTPKKECKYISNLYYGPNDTCPQYRPDRKEVDNVKGSDGQCSTCDYQTCSYYGYQTSCAANQSATEKLTKDQASDGPCYTCEDKPAGSTCKYKHAKVTTSDINGSTTFDPYSKSGHDLYDKLQRHIIESVSYYDAGKKNYHLYNKISKDSKTCYDEKNTLRYETICTDHNKAYCDTQRGKKFTRTCTSEEYNIGLKVESMEFGTCECDLDRRFYKTEDDCLKANESQSLKCTKRDSECYRTCEDEGMYSSEDACMTDTKEYSVKCTKVGNCYKQEMYGFLIKIDEHTIRSFSCRHPSNPNYGMSTYAYLRDVGDGDWPGDGAKTVKGEFGGSFTDSLQQFPAGTYYLCFGTNTWSQYGGNSPTPSVKTVYVDRYPAVVDTIIDVDKTPLKNGCAKVKFEAGTTYSVQFSYTGVPHGDVTCTGN